MSDATSTAKRTPAQKPRLSLQERGKIISLASQTDENGKRKYSYAEIGRKIGCDHKTVTYTFKRHLEHDTKKELPHPGRPRKLDERTERRIRDIVKSDPFASISEAVRKVEEVLNIRVSPWLVRETMLRYGYRKPVARRKRSLA